jgi:hypothetical protein
MENKLQTLNKGEIDACYLDKSLEKVRIGGLIIPTGKFLRFVGELIINKNSERHLYTEEGEITGKFKYDGNFGPKKIIFGNYEIEGKEFGSLAERLIREGYLSETRGDSL